MLTSYPLLLLASTLLIGESLTLSISRGKVKEISFKVGL
jgi:hypothetical protein